MTCASCGSDTTIQAGRFVCPQCGWISLTEVEVRRAVALFVSGLDPAEEPSSERIRTAVGVELVIGDCAARMAQLYGDHPDLFVARMGWCRRQASAAFDHSPV